MKFTIEENREELNRYRHIRPATLLGSVPCSARCPGTLRTCTQKKGHTGPHVAHGMFRRVVAVWYQGIEAQQSKEKVKRAVGGIARNVSRDRGLVVALKAFWSQVIRRPRDMDEVLLFIFGISMAGFAIHWILLAFGLW